MMRPVVRIALGAILVSCAGIVCAGGAYKWRDADGNLHFSDQPPLAEAAKGAQGAVEEIALSGDFADVKVTNKLPIANPRHGGGPRIALEHFDLRVGNNVTIGRKFSGNDCSGRSDVRWTQGVVALKKKPAAAVLGERFHNAGYRLQASEDDAPSATADLYLDADLATFKLDICDSRVYSGNGQTVGGSRSYVRLHWTLRRDGEDKPLYSGSSEGAFNGWRSTRETKDVVFKALAAATDNLLGDKAFVDVLNGISAQVTLSREQFNEVKVAVAYGDSGGSFRTRSEELLRTAVTVRTSRGHGSGVLIDAAGYALTNVHVVRADEEVQVILGDEVVDARVVRSDRKTDVALLQFDAKGHPAAHIARSEPHPGDPLYVVGTPLSIKLSNTVTQGILSAVREVEGERLYQTDAAINPGNSGGPVFNDAGELVALSVSGLFSKSGNSLNINYLIPVARALAAVGVNDE